MAFKDFPEQKQGLTLLQRSLEQGRLGHSYLFSGDHLDELEALARTLAKTLNCLDPIMRGGAAVDCCDRCLNCQKIENDNHSDVFWVRPESKLRVIKIGQITRRNDSPSRVLLDAVNFTPTESAYKIAIVAAADRMNEQAANAFLKTLEEPPVNSVLILLTTDPQRMLDTILSRCLRLNFPGEGPRRADPAQLAWLTTFIGMIAASQKSLLGRYRLLDLLLKKLAELRESIEKTLAARSPLERYPDAEKDLVGKWEDELKAAVEAEYRRQRSTWLGLLQVWLRDLWLEVLQQKRATAGSDRQLMTFPDLTATRDIARRISASQALENLQVMEELHQLLNTNVQEALALEVNLLKMRF